MEDIKDIIESRDNTPREQLEAKIKVLASDVWQDKWDAGDPLCHWLKNFDNVEEQYALYMLSQFMYFNNNTIRELLQRVYQDLYKRPIIFSIRRKNRNTMDEGVIDAKFQKILNKTRFLGLGNPSESGVHMLYYFRQENLDLKKDHFINAYELFDYKIDNDKIIAEINPEKVNRIVFIDDFCGSGDQATEYYDKIINVFKSKAPDIHVSYYALFATNDGLNRVRALGYDEVMSVYILDGSFKCFSENSRHFKITTKLDDCKNQCEIMCRKYGSNLSIKSAMGHGDCQLLLGFHHNTPNNTLPIFWSEKNNWKPIFKRYQKRY